MRQTLMADGDPDVLSASYSDNTIAWYENIDNGAAFTKHTIATNTIQALSVYASDIDADGDMDVLSASDGDHILAWYENLGNGATFTKHSIFAFGAQAVYADDIDADGDIDGVLASFYNSSIEWYENKGIYRLSIDKIGSGTIVSIPATGGINCGTDCQTNLLENATITLSSANPSDYGYIWSGACRATATMVSFRITQHATCTAFYLANPNPFSVTPTLDSALGAFIRSSTITLSGLQATTIISIVGGLYSINGSAPISGASIVKNFDQVNVIIKSPAGYVSRRFATLTVGALSQHFSVITRAQDFTPDQFNLIDQSDVEPGTIIISAAVTVTGIDSTTTVDIIGGSYTINDQVSVATALMKGDLIKVRLLSNMQYHGQASAVLNIGGVTDSFIVITRGQDFTPDQFTFAAQTDVETGTLITSNIATITNIDSTTMISIVGGSYTINGQQTSAATISNNSTVTVLLLSSRHFTTPASAILTIGGVTASFIVTTRAQDFTPDGFENFLSLATDTVNATITSNIQTITGLDINASISIEGGEYQIDNSAFTAASGTINNAQQVAVRLISGSKGITKRVTLTIGTLSRLFEVSTDAVDTSPTIFRFDATRNVELNATITSNQITVSGINQATVIFIENGWYQINDNPVTNTRGLVNANEQVRVLHRSANSYNTTTVSTLTIDSVVATFTSTTRAADTQPNQFAFTPVTNVTPNAVISSEPAEIIGFDQATISIIGGSYTINGGAVLDTASMVFKGDYVAALVLGSAQFSVAANAILDIGGVTASFIVTTRATDTTPNQFAFTPVTNATPNAVISSGPAEIIGFDHATISIIGGSYTINGSTVLDSITTITVAIAWQFAY